ncbi:UDP-glucuronosyltransferase [Penaeus vannamei]|uniref:UDP-glucuronosyltransferase n=1 Tax=Penaeus vannamei TaxID=6689 RepID=A0A423TBF9_PENVA|nr:UDP-glucuronosyltransferase [Penaeus vannamei]
MKWAVLTLALMGVAWAELAPPERSYKILMLLPVSSKSHRNVFLPVAEGLRQIEDTRLGIVILANHSGIKPHQTSKKSTMTCQNFKTEAMDLFATRADPAGVFRMFQNILPIIARKLYKVPKRQSNRKLSLLFTTGRIPFAYEMPFMTIATPGMDARQSAVFGNVLNPAMMQRFLNTIEHIKSAVNWRYLDVLPSVQKEISSQFPDLPPLLDIERNQSLTLLNSHFTVTGVLPLLPSQVEVGAMHCRPGKPLPEDLESWISGAGSEGVVYFSLGSMAQGQSMPKKYRDMFVEAFKQLKQRVIWKYEVALEGVSDNVLMRKWLPQQDILAHPNVRVFITHGGLLSTQSPSTTPRQFSQSPSMRINPRMA